MQKTPAENLEGVELPCGWKAVKYLQKDAAHTGGAFSVGYIAERDGESGFLKALDFKKLMTMGAPSQLDAIKYMTDSFKYERDILRGCRDKGLSRVIRSLSDGEVVVDGFAVPYLIFEIANSDLRKKSIIQSGFNLAWSLRTMHHVCVGMRQLHALKISHQDLKPSNVLVVEDKYRKIGDFGTSIKPDCTLPHANLVIPGDTTYASPEGLYGYSHPDWSVGRIGSDVYQIGSLLVFMLIGAPASTLLIGNLHAMHRPSSWGGTYADVLTYLNNAFTVVIDVISNHIDFEHKAEVISIIRELCEPSLFVRGDPVRRKNKLNPFNLERYISRFDFLARAAEYNLKK